MKYVKQQILHDRKVKDRQLVIKNDGSIELTPLSGEVRVNGNLRVTGESSGPTNSLVYYVSLEGDDANDGLGSGPDRAKRSVKSAVEAAPVGATIQLAPGDYYEDNPITMKERQTVRGDSLRNTQIWPLNNEDDIFFVDNACYIFQVTFRGLRDPGWCVRIKPGALVTTSPYVQNCTNMNGPWLNDGTEFVPFETVQIEGVAPGARPIINDPNVPLAKRVNETGGGNGMLVDGNEYDQRSLVFSMVADAFTQIAQGGIGFHITNFGYTQIVSCFSVFTRIGFLATEGGYLSISNSVSDFGTFAIIADGLFNEVYTTARPTQDYYSTVGSITVNNQGAGYTSAPVVIIEPPTTPGGIQATGTASIDPATGKVTAVTVVESGSGYDFIPTIQFVGGGFSISATGTVNLILNRIIEVDSLRDQPQVGSIIQFEGDSTKYYVTETNVTTQPFIYEESVCRRDVRRIVDAVAGDMALGTNYQSLAAARSYLRSTSALVIQQQLAPTIYGIEAARDEMLARVPDTDPTNLESRYRIIENFAIITNVLQQGDSTAAPDVNYDDLPTINSGIIAAKDNIIANRDFIVEEVTNYIAEQFTFLSYNQDKCERDVRQIVAAVAYDVALGTNYNSVIAGKAYARANASVVYQKQKVQTIAAYEYLKSLILALPTVVSDATATARASAAMDEIIEIISQGDSTSADDLVFPPPTDVIANRVYAKDHLRNNREFIQTEIVKWVNSEYPTLDYDEDSCFKDVGHIVDGLSYDVLYGGNSASRDVATAYFVGTQSQLGTGETAATIAAYDRLKEIITQIIQGDPIIKSPGNLLTQDFTASNATGVEADRCGEYIDLIIGVIEDGSLDNLEEVQYPSVLWATSALQNARSSIFSRQDEFAEDITEFLLDNYPEFTYDRTKCKRDVELILDAVNRDIKLGTNHNAIVAGQAYLRGTAGVVDAEQKPATILSIRYLQSLAEESVSDSTVAVTRCRDSFEALLNIIEFEQTPSEGTTFPAPGPASQELIDAARLLQENRDFLIEETIAYIANTYFVYDAAKCSRDTDLIIDAVALDLVLGTNFNSITAGLAYQRAVSAYVISDQIVETIAAITFLRSEVATLLAGDPTSVATTNALFDEIIDIIQNGVGSADALTWTDPGVDANKLYARQLIQTNRTFIINELISWINTTFPSLVYNQAKCERDTGYILDALSHDVQYGTNYGSIIAAKAYFEGAVSVLPVGQIEPTKLAIQQLIDIVDDVIIENRPGQTLTGNPASSAEMDEVAGLLTILVNVINDNSIESIPSVIQPDVSWANPTTVASRDLLVSRGDSTGSDLVQSVIDYINTSLNGLSYNESKCRRDTGYLIDAVTHDMLYGGNRSILISARSYYDDNISTVLGQEAQTADALEHLRDVSGNVIEGILVIPTTGNTEPQVISGTFGTPTESLIAVDLYNIVITAIVDSQGLGTTPANQDPAYNWISSLLRESADTLLTNSTTFQQNVIDYITNNIIGFSYNVEKCQRDTGYIIDAAVYDMMYGGNKQTRRAAEAYYSGAILGSALVGTTDQIDITEFSYKHLADVLNNVAQNIAITPSDGATLTQTFGLIDGSSAAGSYIALMVDKIAEVVQNPASLPDEIDHSYSALADATLNSKRVLILNDIDDIEDESIRLLNLQFGGVAELTLFPGVLAVEQGTLGSMQNVSTVSTAGHAFEYVGAGITYNALPFFGGSPISENEFVETNTGKVFVTSTDQIGNFRVGNFFAVNALTGAITINANEINLTGISSIGPFQRFGIPVGVELKEVSDSTNLIASTGNADANTVPTQNAVVNYVENRYLNKITGSTVLGPTIFEDDLAVNGGDLTTTASTFNLVNDNANTVNFAGGAAFVNIGDLIGTTTVNNSLVVRDDLKISENPTGNVTTDSTTINFLNATATTVNAFGDASTINIGDTTGVLTIRNNQVVIDSVDSLQIPVGNTADRPDTLVTGQIRFNTDILLFEGYNGVAWASLVGTVDSDRDTYIVPESGPGLDEDTLQIFTAGIERASISPTTFEIDSTIDTIFNSTTQATSNSTGAITLAGGMGILGNLYVGGRIGGDIQIGENESNVLTIRSQTVLAPDSLRLITYAPDSAADDIVYPLTLAHHTLGGIPVAGSGTGLKFELETTNGNFETSGIIEVVAQDVTGTQEDFDMVFRTMNAGSPASVKLTLSETTATFTTNLQVDQNLFVTGILDASGFRGSIFADDSTEIIDSINNKLTVVNADIGTLALTTDLEVQYGGTGRSVFTGDGIVYGNESGALQVTDNAGSSDQSVSFQILTVVGDGNTTPIWTDTIDGGEF
jgi:hypothetical protein